jgi:AAA15 family ATPase/GTPase
VTLDFTCGCYKEHLDTTAPFCDKRYNKMISMFGPNASGKTTLVRALTNLKNMLRLENGGLRNGLLPFNPFAFEDGSDQPTLYHIVFTKDHVLFDYLLMFNQDAITYESAPESQLIFTTHNTSIMCDELFRRDQIWFFDKNDDGETDLFSLADFKARPTDNYERDYLLGRYGAVPAVITFLKEDTPQ